MAKNNREKGMLMDKKKKDGKSIYDYELKDINKDGKKGFGDTWLGDALGFDGKIGTQGPGMKESMKGARRNMGGEDKKPTRPKARPESKQTRPKARPKTGPAGASGTGPGPTQGGATGPQKEKKQMAGTGGPRRQSNRTKSKPMFTAPKEGQKKANEKASKTSTKGKFLHNTERKDSPRTETTGERVQSNREKAWANRVSGMNRGGMVQNGEKDYKKSGMFYKSGSPRGYK